MSVTAQRDQARKHIEDLLSLQITASLTDDPGVHEALSDATVAHLRDMSRLDLEVVLTEAVSMLAKAALGGAS